MTATERLKACQFSLDSSVWSRNARNYLHVLAFAGFDVRRIMIAAMRRSSSDKISQPTIERAWDDCYAQENGEYVER